MTRSPEQVVTATTEKRRGRPKNKPPADIVCPDQIAEDLAEQIDQIMLASSVAWYIKTYSELENKMGSEVPQGLKTLIHDGTKFPFAGKYSQPEYKQERYSFRDPVRQHFDQNLKNFNRGMYTVCLVQQAILALTDICLHIEPACFFSNERLEQALFEPKRFFKAIRTQKALALTQLASRIRKRLPGSQRVYFEQKVLADTSASKPPRNIKIKRALLLFKTLKPEIVMDRKIAIKDYNEIFSAHWPDIPTPNRLKQIVAEILADSGPKKTGLDAWRERIQQLHERESKTIFGLSVTP